jgi:hypothetical protein
MGITESWRSYYIYWAEKINKLKPSSTDQNSQQQQRCKTYCHTPPGFFSVSRAGSDKTRSNET